MQKYLSRLIPIPLTGSKGTMPLERTSQVETHAYRNLAAILKCLENDALPKAAFITSLL